jgi:hypothetical protein
MAMSGVMPKTQPAAPTLLMSYIVCITLHITMGASNHGHCQGSWQQGFSAPLVAFLVEKDYSF